MDRKVRGNYIIKTRWIGMSKIHSGECLSWKKRFTSGDIQKLGGVHFRSCWIERIWSVLIYLISWWFLFSLLDLYMDSMDWTWLRFGRDRGRRVSSARKELGVSLKGSLRVDLEDFYWLTRSVIGEESSEETTLAKTG